MGFLGNDGLGKTAAFAELWMLGQVPERHDGSMDVL